MVGLRPLASQLAPQDTQDGHQVWELLEAGRMYSVFAESNHEMSGGTHSDETKYEP